MKIATLMIGWSAGVLAAMDVQAQGIFFQNLDFESANLYPIPSGQGGGEVPITSALPGWRASLGSVSTTQVLQNSFTVGSASIDIFGPNLNTVNPGIIDGNYTVALQWGYGPGLIEESASLSQRGTIPANAESLQFWPSLQRVRRQHSALRRPNGAA
jgi:hypothetical protein